MIYITGPGRCGTSFLAKFCKEIGLDVAGAWDTPTDSGMEDISVKLLHGAGWASREDAIETFIRQYNREVLKDCMLFREPGIARKWFKLRPDIRLVGCWRDPVHMAKSWVRKCSIEESMRGADEDYFAEWATICKEKFEDICSVHDKEIHWLTFPDYLDDFDAVYDALGLSHPGEYLFPYLQGRPIFEKLVDRSKVHFP